MLNSIKNLFRWLQNWWHSSDTAETNPLLLINDTAATETSSYSKIMVNYTKYTGVSIFNITTTSGSASEIVKVMYEAIKGCEIGANCPDAAQLIVNYPSVAVGIANLVIDLFPHHHEKVWKTIRNILANVGLTLHCILAVQTDFARMSGQKGNVYESTGAFAGEIIASIAIGILLNDNVRTYLTHSVERKCRNQLAAPLTNQLLEQSPINEPIDNRGIFAKISDAFFGWLNGYFSGRGFILSMEQLFVANSSDTFAGTWTRHGIGFGYGIVTGILSFLYQPISKTDQEVPHLQTALNIITDCMQTIFFTTSLAKNLTQLHHDANQKDHFITITTLWSTIALATLMLAAHKTYRKPHANNQHDSVTAINSSHIPTTESTSITSETTLNHRPLQLT